MEIVRVRSRRGLRRHTGSVGAAGLAGITSAPHWTDITVIGQNELYLHHYYLSPIALEGDRNIVTICIFHPISNLYAPVM